MVVLLLLVNGLSLGAVYGIIAIGFGLIVTTTRVFHIAHSATYLMGGYIFFILIRFLDAPLPVAVAGALVASALFGLVVDRVTYRPIVRRGGGMFTVFIASMGVSLIVEAFYVLLFRGVPSVARTETLAVLQLGPASIRSIDLLSAATGLLVYASLFFWLYKTNAGLAIRGLADNATLASIFVDTSRVRNTVFAVGSALAGLGGVIAAYDSGITPAQGFDALFVGIVALIVGGMGNVVLGTLVGGMVFGMLKVVSGYFFPKWFYFFVFSVLMVSIILRPEGLVSQSKRQG